MKKTVSSLDAEVYELQNKKLDFKSPEIISKILTEIKVDPATKEAFKEHLPELTFLLGDRKKNYNSQSVDITSFSNLIQIDIFSNLKATLKEAGFHKRPLFMKAFNRIPKPLLFPEAPLNYDSHVRMCRPWKFEKGVYIQADYSLRT